MGSFDTRPLSFSGVSATLSIRRFFLDKIFQTFPRRKFILVGDTSHSDVMSDYPELVAAYPGQVLCIFIKNSSVTPPSTTSESDDPFPYNTDGFKDVDKKMYMFFKHADDLMGLDIANGQCRNETIEQNVGFGWENMAFGSEVGTPCEAAPSMSLLRAFYVIVFTFVGMVGVMMSASACNPQVAAAAQEARGRRVRREDEIELLERRRSR